MKRNHYSAFSLVMSHAITMAVTLYMAYRGGLWLDERLGTSPWLMIVALLLMVTANLHLLVKDLLNQTGKDRDDHPDDPR